jgi:hypothetical protein
MGTETVGGTKGPPASSSCLGCHNVLPTCYPISTMQRDFDKLVIHDVDSLAWVLDTNLGRPCEIVMREDK